MRRVDADWQAVQQMGIKAADGYLHDIETVIAYPKIQTRISFTDSPEQYHGYSSAVGSRSFLAQCMLQ